MMENDELLPSRHERLRLFAFQHTANYESSVQIADSLMRIADELVAIRSKPRGEAVLGALFMDTLELLRMM
jgi:hypothetical protein